jgi:hypothetical protein
VRARLYSTLGLVGLAIVLAAPPAPGATRSQAREAQSPPAGAFVRNVLHLRTTRHYASLWSKLHPAQKAFITKGEFIACEKKKDAALGAALRLIAFTVIRSHRETIRIPGTQQTTRSTNVRYRYTLTTGEERVGPITDSSHAVRVNGRWTWLVSPKDASAYKAGTCRIP